jgi:hypothetical protein
LAAYLAVSTGVAAAVGVAMIRDEVPARREASARPALALLTSLPLVFGESFSLQGGGSPALTRLEQRYKVVPIGVANAASLKGQKLLLMAHPRAQPAEALVELDQWVRDGGRLLLLADPKLDWPSKRPLGDVLRPPPAFADTGLLGHWGLQLSSPGSLESRGKCRVRDQGLVARCRIGSGQATVVADADFINVDGPEASGLDLLMVELDRLETR